MRDKPRNANQDYKNIFYTHNGEEKSLSEWSKEWNAQPGTVLRYIEKHGWKNACRHYADGEPFPYKKVYRKKTTAWNCKRCRQCRWMDVRLAVCNYCLDNKHTRGRIVNGRLVHEPVTECSRFERSTGARRQHGNFEG